MKETQHPFFARPVPAALFLLVFLIVGAAAALAGARALRDRANLQTGGACWICCMPSRVRRWERSPGGWT